MKIQKINKLTESLNSIPKINIDNATGIIGRKANSLMDKDIFPEMISHLGEASQIEQGSDALTQVVTHAEHNFLGGAMLLRLIDPMIELSKGNFSAALKKTAVNAVDVVMYKARLIYGGLGAIRGLIVKMRGAETPDAGFIKGYFYAIKHWGKGRRTVENALINPKQFWQDLKNNPEATQYAEYCERMESEINKHKNIILQRSERNKREIESWGETKVQMLEASQEKLDCLIAREKSNQLINKQKMQGYRICNNDLISKIESLKFLQQRILDNYNSCMQEITEMTHSVTKNSKEYDAMQEISNLSKNYYKEECNSINETIDFTNKILKFNEVLYKKFNQKGFNRIAGYKELKLTLKNKFINSVANNNSVPDMILFYGPKGCGKTLFSQALAEESKCNTVKIELTLDSEQDFNNLQKAIREARELYERLGIHTIIHIDELDAFLPDRLFKPNEIQNLISSLGENHCTLVATTNYPNNINTILYNSNAEKFYIGPPDKKNIQEVLMYYMKDFVDEEINYQSLASLIQKKAENKYFSNAKIAESIIYGLKENLSSNNNRLNQKYFESIIQTIEPDIENSSSNCI